jgi:hypothetical protein
VCAARGISRKSVAPLTLVLYYFVCAAQVLLARRNYLQPIPPACSLGAAGDFFGDEMTMTALLLALTIAPLLALDKNEIEPFQAKAVTRRGTIRLNAAAERVFPLFGPVQEKQWVSTWNPQIVWPSDRDVAEGMVFLTHNEPYGDTHWVVTRFDAAQHFIAYANFTPGDLANRIEIRCRAAGAGATECEVMYAHVALGERGNAVIEHMDEKAYAAKMAHWQEAINYALEHGRPMDQPHR